LAFAFAIALANAFALAIAFPSTPQVHFPLPRASAPTEGSCAHHSFGGRKPPVLFWWQPVFNVDLPPHLREKIT
jgi:hypothetical protein